MAAQAASAYEDPYFAQTLHGVADAGAGDDYLAAIVTVPEGETTADTCLRLWRAQRVDGCVLTSVADDDRSVAALDAAELPYVVLGAPPSGAAGPAVDVDNTAAMAELGQHLLALGHRRFAFVAGVRRLPGLRELEEGFVAVVRAAGAHPPLVFVGESTIAGGRAAVQQALAAPRPWPTAFVCANDLMAAGAMRALQDAGLRVPAEVSVSGVDDNPLATLLRPQLTTLRKPVRALGEEAMRLLLLQMGGKCPPGSPRRRRMVLVHRESTAPPP